MIEVRIEFTPKRPTAASPAPQTIDEIEQVVEQFVIAHLADGEKIVRVTATVRR